MDLTKALNLLEVHGKPRIDLFQIPDSVELLSAALEQICVDINERNKRGETLLFKSIELDYSDEFIIHLLNANPDLNISNKNGKAPLSMALERDRNVIVEELLKRGADVHPYVNVFSVLHEAVELNNFKAICLLLYYGADVNAMTQDGGTPLGRALFRRNFEACNVMVNYYNGCTINEALYYPIQFDTNLGVRLIELGVDVNYITHDVNYLETCLFYNNCSMFKLIWKRIDYQIIVGKETPFLLTVLDSPLRGNDWLDVLTSILISPVAFELAQECNNASHRFFRKLYEMFHTLSVTNFCDRIRIVYLALSLSIKVNLEDALCAYHLYGFEDLEILMYFLTNWDLNSYYIGLRSRLVPIFFGIEDVIDAGVYAGMLNFDETNFLGDIDTDWVGIGYFNQSYYRILLGCQWSKAYPMVTDKLLRLPEFPTLLELSREQARKFIRQVYGVNTPPEFHDAVKSLNLPEYIKDVIRFKTPIYL